jgi:hypothetical protein
MAVAVGLADPRPKVDLRFAWIEDIIQDGNKVVVRSTITGTQ